MKLIAPSILSADFANLPNQIRLAELGGADWIHCDVMDGQFVPNLTFGPIIIQAVKSVSKIPLDVHLMIKTPDNLLEEFAKAGANVITVHREEVIHLHRTITKIKQLGCKAGVSINPATPLSSVEDILDEIDLLLIMSVNPGFGGQSFIKSSLKKIEAAAELKHKHNYKFFIEVDGGVSKDTIEDISNAGCEVFVAGSAIFHAENITAATAVLKNIVNK